MDFLLLLFPSQVLVEAELFWILEHFGFSIEHLLHSFGDPCQLSFLILNDLIFFYLSFLVSFLNLLKFKFPELILFVHGWLVRVWLDQKLLWKGLLTLLGFFIHIRIRMSFESVRDLAPDKLKTVLYFET